MPSRTEFRIIQALGVLLFVTAASAPMRDSVPPAAKLEWIDRSGLLGLVDG